MHPLLLLLDPYLIYWYRLTGQTRLDFFLGTFVLAVLALALGKLCSLGTDRLVRHYRQRFHDEASRYQDLSIQALEAGDRQAYEAANKLANEAFGRSFFLNIATSAAFIWPIFLALGWLQARFEGISVPLPLVPLAMGPLAVFVLTYVGVYLGWRWLRRRLRPSPSPPAASGPVARESPGERPDLASSGASANRP